MTANSDVNMMSVQNVSVCFGPTLLRSSSSNNSSSNTDLAMMGNEILNIKFGNMVVAAMLDHWHKVLRELDHVA